MRHEIYLNLNTMSTSNTKTYIFYASLFIIFCAKWACIYPQEILSEMYDGHRYVLASLNYSYSFGSSVGYSLWIAAARHTGIPLRLCTEILWIACALYFTFTILKITKRFTVAVVIFFILSFYPYTFYYFQVPLTETLTVSIALFFTTTTIRICCAEKIQDRFKYYFCLGLAGGLWTLARNEEYIVICSFIIILTLIFILDMYICKSRAIRTLKTFICGAFIVMIAFQIPLVTIKSINKRTFGVYALYSTKLPSLNRLFNDLASIEISRPNPRYVSITSDAINMAYKVSPTFLSFKKCLDNPNSPGRLVTKQKYGIEGEIISGWLYWEILGEASKLFNGDYRQMESYFKKISKEIELAFSTNELKRRHVLHWAMGDMESFIGYWLTSLKESMRRIHIVITPKDFNFINSYGFDEYNKACNRRTALLENRFQLSGWFFIRSNSIKITELRIYDHMDYLQPSSTIRLEGEFDIPRDDVASAYKVDKADDQVYGFSVHAFISNDKIPAVHIISNEKTVGILSADQLVGGRISTFTNSGGDIIVGIDKSFVYSSAHGWRKTVEKAILSTGNSSIPWMILLSGFAIGITVIARRIIKNDNINAFKKYMLASCTLFFIALGSFSFYYIFELSAWEGGPRFFITTGVLLMVSCLTTISLSIAKE